MEGLTSSVSCHHFYLRTKDINSKAGCNRPYLLLLYHFYHTDYYYDYYLMSVFYNDEGPLRVIFREFSESKSNNQSPIVSYVNVISYPVDEQGPGCR